MKDVLKSIRDEAEHCINRILLKSLLEVDSYGMTYYSYLLVNLKNIIRMIEEYEKD